MRKVVLILITFLSLTVFNSCRETNEEKTEDAIEDAVDETEDAMDDAADEVEDAVD